MEQLSRRFIKHLIVLLTAVVLAVGWGATVAVGEEPSDGAGQSGAVANATAAQEGQVDAQAAGGPVVIMGIDAEDGGPGGHGPIANYVSVLNSIIANAPKGAGLLVVGGGKSPTDDVTEFWDAVAAGSSIPVTYVNGAANITAQSFAAFKVIGVASGDGETSSGGLTAAESEALAARQADIAAHVNGGGGLLVFAQDFDDATTSQYAFLGGFGSFTFTTELSYADIDPTADGTAIGVTDALDICCWHDTYQTWPSFLTVLARVAVTDTPAGEVAALGGVAVFIGPEPEPAPPVEVVPAFTG